MINFTLRPVYPRERTPVSIQLEAGWARASVGIQIPDRPVGKLAAI
jgi:hypothetical protein